VSEGPRRPIDSRAVSERRGQLVVDVPGRGGGLAAIVSVQGPAARMRAERRAEVLPRRRPRLSPGGPITAA
jgi:DNA-binding IclR family transcriptional regulator